MNIETHSGTTENSDDANVALIGQAVDSLREGLWKMPQEERQALLLHRIGGLNPEEIAVRLGLGVQAVERKIASAIAHLQHIYFIGDKL